ncbi:unnamed protein product [Amoebophrya sp. A25]|nr:unnamed protein product [Amoebophrya sp. A25]|eukprot:GSA25T00021494001.1
MGADESYHSPKVADGVVSCSSRRPKSSLEVFGPQEKPSDYYSPWIRRHGKHKGFLDTYPMQLQRFCSPEQVPPPSVPTPPNHRRTHRTAHGWNFRIMTPHRLAYYEEERKTAAALCKGVTEGDEIS